jgi:ribosome modulation factor
MATVDECIESSIEGRSARREGMARASCPYGDGTGFRRFWLWGWDAEDNRQTLHPVFADIINAHVTHAAERRP